MLGSSSTRSTRDRLRSNRAAWLISTKYVVFTVSAIIAAAVLLITFALPGAARPPINPQEPDDSVEEVVANLAAGRVIIAVFKDAIVIGTVENPIETASMTPPIVPVSSGRAGVLLGAVDWTSPSSHQVLARLHRELPHIRAYAPGFTQGPHLTEEPNTTVAHDIEQLGLGLFGRLSGITEQIHGHLNMKSDEPLTQLVVVDYLPAYGAEVWLISYSLKQQPERGDFWQTRLLRPRYSQLWPPEKNAPRTLVEFDYPEDAQTVPMRDMMLAHEPSLQRLHDTSGEMGWVADSILHGEIDKRFSAAGLPFMRAALETLANGHRIQLAVIRPDTGFAWVVAPPPEPKLPGEDKLRPPDAPTLEHAPEDAPTLQPH